MREILDPMPLCIVRQFELGMFSQISTHIECTMLHGCLVVVAIRTKEDFDGETKRGNEMVNFCS